MAVAGVAAAGYTPAPHETSVDVKLLRLRKRS
jgi:hypothetical protein